MTTWNVLKMACVELDVPVIAFHQLMFHRSKLQVLTEWGPADWFSEIAMTQRYGITKQIHLSAHLTMTHPYHKDVMNAHHATGITLQNAPGSSGALAGTLAGLTVIEPNVVALVLNIAFNST
jgi:hypothetical protein